MFSHALVAAADERYAEDASLCSGDLCLVGAVETNGERALAALSFAGDADRSCGRTLIGTNGEPVDLRAELKFVDMPGGRARDVQALRRVDPNVEVRLVLDVAPAPGRRT